MPEQQLREALAQLHEELSATRGVSGPLREQLKVILADIADLLERSDAADEAIEPAETKELATRARASALSLEGHPHLAGLLGSVIDALAQMGI